MIIIKYGPNLQGIKEVEIQPQLVDSLAKKNKENKKRPEQKKEQPKEKGRNSKGCSHTTKEGKGVETKTRSTKVHYHTTKTNKIVWKPKKV
jgi:hypothetical protein